VEQQQAQDGSEHRLHPPVAELPDDGDGHDERDHVERVDPREPAAPEARGTVARGVGPGEHEARQHEEEGHPGREAGSDLRVLGAVDQQADVADDDAERGEEPQAGQPVEAPLRRSGGRHVLSLG
jgi:hypothetical protein